MREFINEFINNLMDCILYVLPLGIMATITVASINNRDDDDNDVSFAAPAERNKNSENSLSVILHQESFFSKYEKKRKNERNSAKNQRY